MTVYRVENMEHSVSFIEDEGLTAKAAANIFIGNGEGYSDWENIYAGCHVDHDGGRWFAVYGYENELVDHLMVDEYIMSPGEEFALSKSEEDLAAWIRSLYDH